MSDPILERLEEWEQHLGRYPPLTKHEVAALLRVARAAHPATEFSRVGPPRCGACKVTWGGSLEDFPHHPTCPLAALVEPEEATKS